MNLLMTHSIGCTAAFTQMAGVAALEGPQDDLKVMLVEYQKRRDYVCQRFNAIPGVKCAVPAGAFYAFPNIEGIKGTCSEIADRILNEGGVAVLPGNAFGPAGEKYFRISYVRGMDELKEGMDRI